MSVNTIERFATYQISDSITVIGNVSDAVDYNTPLDFKKWLTYFNNTSLSIETYNQGYKEYISEWDSIKTNVLQNQTEAVNETYVNLIKQIKLDVQTEQERQFLNSIDYSDDEQIETIVPLVTSKINDLTKYYKQFREIVKTQPKKNNIYSSNFGIKQYIKQLIVDLLNYDPETISLIKKYNINKELVINNINLTIDDLYDEYTDYFDIYSQEDKNNYEYGGELRNKQWNSNTNPWDFDLWLNYDNSTVRLLSTYNYVIEQLPNLSLPVSLNSTDVSYFKNKDFINEYNTGNINDLNLINKKKLFEKFTGSDWYYLTSGNTTSELLSSKFLKAENISQNYLNRNNVSTATVPNSAYLVTSKDIGGFYTPSKLGILLYNTFSYTYTYNTQLIQPNSIYYFPDPNKYIATYGNSKFIRTGTIFNVTENAQVVTYNVSDSAAFGYINDRSKYLNFHGYQNFEEKQTYYNFGVARPSDKIEFFKGKLDTVWSNNDVFNITNRGKYTIDERQNTLNVTQNSITTYTSDTNGKDYTIYKPTTPLLFTSLSSSYTTNYYTFFSLGVFVEDGTDFDFTSTSGTVSDIIPGVKFTRSGVELIGTSFTQTINSTLTYGVFTMPWITNSNITYVRGPIYDGVVFVGYNNILLQDEPSSSSPAWTINDDVYYNLLLDGGSTSSNTRPNYRDVATFYGNLSAVVDGGKFVYPTTDPFNTNVIKTSRYDIQYYDTVNNSLSTTYITVPDITKRSIYDKKNVLTGQGYVRDNNLVTSLSANLSSIFVKYISKPSIYNELNNNIIKFDVVYDVLIIETPNYIVIDQSSLNSTNTTYIQRTTQGDNNFEQFGNFYLHEPTNTIIFNRTTLLPTLSATNYRTLYPTFYKLELDSLNFKQIFPNNNNNKFGSLSSYSLRSYVNPRYDSVNFNNDDYIYNINTLNKPSLSYDVETNTYAYSIKMQDPADCLALWYQTYKFINGKFVNDINEIYFQNAIVRDENYYNPLTASFIEYNALAGSNNVTWIQKEGVLKLGE